MSSIHMTLQTEKGSLHQFKISEKNYFSQYSLMSYDPQYVVTRESKTKIICVTKVNVLL
jgi:hypothetical protein